MEASAAAARLIEDYKGRKRRLGSQKATYTPTKAIRRPHPLLLLPAILLSAILLSSLLLLPRTASEGFATLDGRPLANMDIVLTCEDGEKNMVSTDGKGEFVAHIPEGVYSASLEGREEELVGPKGMKIYPGRRFRVCFSKPPSKDKHLTSNN